MIMRVLILITLASILFGCANNEVSDSSSYNGEESEPQIVYKETDIDDVQDAKAIIDRNRIKRVANVSKGFERADRFDPLINDLIAFANYDYELKLEDVRPYTDELHHVSAIFTNEESKEFTRTGAEDSMAINKLYSEAKKGEINNKAYKEMEEKVAQLQKEKDAGYSEMIVSTAQRLLYMGAFIFALGLFTNVTAIAPIAGKARGTGLSLLAIGGLVLTIGTFVESVREFLEVHGNWLMLLFAVPVIILVIIFAGFFAKKEIEDIQEEE